MRHMIDMKSDSALQASATHGVRAVQELQHALCSRVDERLPRAILGVRLSGSDDDRDIKEALRQLILHTTVLNPFNDTGEFRFGDVNELYHRSREADCTDHVVEVLNYLRLYQALAELIRPLIVDANEVWFGHCALPNAVDEFVGAVESLEDFDPTLMSTLLVLGKLHGLRDRAEARRMFVRSKPGLDAYIGVFMGELGARTYLDRSVLERNEELIAERRASLAGSWCRYGQICPADTRFLVLMSCDQRFFEIYFPYWLSVAEYLRPLGFAFHFIVAEPPGKASRLVSDAAGLRSALRRFRGYRTSGSSKYLLFFGWGTFLVSETANVFGLRALSLRAGGCRTSRIAGIVQDIDFHLAWDPRPWFKSLPADKICLTSSRVAISIDPWQKFRGGAYGFPVLDEALTAATWLEDYLMYGLGDEHSWFLDQNALGFLYERIEGEGLIGNLLFSLDDLRPLLRPSAELATHPLWEERHDLQRS
jgi:hypothetical protein